MRHIIFIVFLLALNAGLFAQTRWYRPESIEGFQIHGQAFSSSLRANIWHRLPLDFKDRVTEKLWKFACHSAGESIVFTTDSRNISVRYTVAGPHAMHHMPATGVSGVDMYTTDCNGNQVWLAARASFKDSVLFDYSPVDMVNGCTEGQRYTLYLPLYNEILDMEIGIDEGAFLRFEKPDGRLPVVAYGSSICQGACASRPGMSWSNILQRNINHPVINLGFSGSAYLEKEVINLISQIDAEVYIIDAMPNAYNIRGEALRDTIVNAISFLRARRPDTPILIADHLGYPHSGTSKHYRESQEHAWKMLAEAMEILKTKGVTGLYFLSTAEIGMPADATVEAIHPSDWGMAVYAKAYMRKLREIMSGVRTVSEN